MKRHIVILLALLISYPLLSQPFLYDRYGKLKYIVSDSLLKEIPSESASMFMEHYKTNYFRMGGHIIGYSTTKVFKLVEDKVEIADTLYCPVLMDKEVTIKSIKTFRAFVQYVIDNYQTSETYVKYDFVDDDVDVMIRVATDIISGKWRVIYKNEEYKIESLPSLISKLDKLIADFTNIISSKS